MERQGCRQSIALNPLDVFGNRKRIDLEDILQQRGCGNTESEKGIPRDGRIFFGLPLRERPDRCPLDAICMAIIRQMLQHLPLYFFAHRLVGIVGESEVDEGISRDLRRPAGEGRMDVIRQNLVGLTRDGKYQVHVDYVKAGTSHQTDLFDE